MACVSTYQSLSTHPQPDTLSLIEENGSFTPEVSLIPIFNGPLV